MISLYQLILSNFPCVAKFENDSICSELPEKWNVSWICSKQQVFAHSPPIVCLYHHHHINLNLFYQHMEVSLVHYPFEHLHQVNLSLQFGKQALSHAVLPQSNNNYYYNNIGQCYFLLISSLTGLFHRRTQKTWGTGCLSIHPGSGCDHGWVC